MTHDQLEKPQSSIPAQERPKETAGPGQHRYFILIAASVAAGMTGATYMWSIFTTPLMEAHGWLSTEVSLAYSLYFVMQFLMGFVAGALQKRAGTHVLTIIGGISYSAAWILMGHADSLPMLYFAFSFLGGGGAGFAYNAAVSTATKWFPDKKGFANGLCIGITGLLPVVFAPLGDYLLENFDLSSALLAVGMIPLVLYLIFGWFVKAPADDWKPAGWEPSEHADISQRNVTTGEMVKTPLFWTMLLAFAFSASSGSMVTSHASAMGQAFIGLTAAQAALQVSLLALGNFLGRFGFGALSDHIGRSNTLLLSLGITLVDMIVIFPLAHDFTTFAIAVILVGMCYGSTLTVIPSLCGDLFGTKNFGQNYGVLFSGLSIASIIGPMTAAGIVDATGSYTMALACACGFAVVGIIMVLAMKHFAKAFRTKD
ncbi:MAG: OFA family MFS transporter [Eggerthellaceae bacterium]